MVGVQGFEPWTPCSQSRCATRLRYTPTESIFYTDRAFSGKSCKIRGMVAYFSSKSIKSLRAIFALALLVICLLGTRWVGLDHGITHSNLQQHAVNQAIDGDLTTSINHSSSVCHLFDALTLAGFAGSFSKNHFVVPFFARTFTSPQTLADSQRLNTPYLSRAPPALIL